MQARELPIAWSTSPFEYGLLILAALMLAGFVLSFGSAATTGIGVTALLLATIMAFYGVIGVLRPRLVQLDAETMSIRPVIGAAKRYARKDIVSVRETISVPFASLMAGVRRADGKVRMVTVNDRLVLADISVREGGRTVGIVSSTRGRLFVDWAGLPSAAN